MAGLNWQALHDQYLARVNAAADTEDVRQAMNELIHKLPSSHLALIPAEAYTPTEPSGSAAQKAEETGDVSGSTGITVTWIDQKIVVEFSENSALHPGWIVESIDGDSIKRLIKLAGEAEASVVPEIIQDWLSGPVGSSVHIVFVKGDGTKTALDIPRRTPAGKLFEFGNLPPERVVAEHRKLR